MAAVPVASGSVLMPAAVFIEVGDPLHQSLHHPHHQHHHPHGYAHRSSPVRFDSIFKAGNQYQGTRWELRELSPRRHASALQRRGDATTDAAVAAFHTRVTSAGLGGRFLFLVS